MMLHAIKVARSHFAKEENILFPMANQILGASTLQQLTSKWIALRMAKMQAMGHCGR